MSVNICIQAADEDILSCSCSQRVCKSNHNVAITTKRAVQRGLVGIRVDHCAGRLSSLFCASIPKSAAPITFTAGRNSICTRCDSGLHARARCRQ